MWSRISCKFLVRPGLQDKTQVLLEKSRTHLAQSHMRLMLRVAALRHVIASAFHHIMTTRTTAAFNHHHVPKISCFPWVTMAVGNNNNRHDTSHINKTLLSSRRRCSLVAMLAAGGGGGGGFFFSLFGNNNKKFSKREI